MKKKTAGPQDPEEQKGKRSENWATLIYPESCPDFVDKVSNLLISAFLSPLHCDPESDELTERKPHYHLLCKFSSVKSREQVDEIFKPLGFVGAERISDFRTYARYLCHLDQPLKKQYDPGDVLSFGGLDYLGVIAASADKYRIIAEIIEYCDENPDEVKDSFSCLMKICIEKKKTDWFRALCDYAAYVITNYLQSLHWTRKQDMKEEYQKRFDNDYCL